MKTGKVFCTPPTPHLLERNLFLIGRKGAGAIESLRAGDRALVTRLRARVAALRLELARAEAELRAVIDR